MVTSTESPFFFVIKAEPSGDSFRKAAVHRIGFGRTDDRELVHRTRLRVLDLYDGAEMDFVLRVLRRIDDARVTNHRFDFKNAAFDEGLLLFRVFVFGVFGDVAELFGLPDTLVDFATMDGLELVELFLEFGQPLLW